MGELAQKYWFEIPKHFPFVKLDEFVVMSNPIHGIIEIAKTKDERGNISGRDNILEYGNVSGYGNITGRGNVETQNFASLQSPQSQNLASIIRGYKMGVTKLAKIIDYK